jgi:hypothetical protein
MTRASRAFFSSGVSFAGGAGGFGFAAAGVLVSGSAGADSPPSAADAAGMVVPLEELPEGALPVSAA